MSRGEGVFALMERSTDLLDAIAELHSQYPDWRFGQLISNIAGWADQDIWDVEDEQLLEVAQKHLQTLAMNKPRSKAPGSG
jgi:hypothetical protein